jgi:hypothetical protein
MREFLYQDTNWQIYFMEFRHEGSKIVKSIADRQIYFIEYRREGSEMYLQRKHEANKECTTIVELLDGESGSPPIPLLHLCVWYPECVRNSPWDRRGIPRYKFTCLTQIQPPYHDTTTPHFIYRFIGLCTACRALHC